MKNGKRTGGFYKNDFAPTEKEEFITYYADKYYKKYKNSKWVEDQIDNILKNRIGSKEDVSKILAWKTGKIKHCESEEKKEFCYASDWNNLEKKNKGFIGYVTDNAQKLSEENPQKVLNALKEKSPSGIGTVNLINLLYFLSKGEKPIYDKYAYVAISEMHKERSPKYSENEPIKYSEPPDKNSKEFHTICEDGVYKDYCDMIDAVFGLDEYKKNRDIDRALWAYGHEFVIK